MTSSYNDRFQAAVRRRKLKERAIEYLGGHCVVCNYEGTPAAFDFHHIHGKDFNVGSRITFSWDRVVEELSKCVLVCARCHREIHDGLHPQWMGHLEDAADAWDSGIEEAKFLVDEPLSLFI
jgi:sugar phosphate isomerase/epimerase